MLLDNNCGLGVIGVIDVSTLMVNSQKLMCVISYWFNLQIVQEIFFLVDIYLFEGFG